MAVEGGPRLDDNCLRAGVSAVSEDEGGSAGSFAIRALRIAREPTRQYYFPMIRGLESGVHSSTFWHPESIVCVILC